MLTFRDWIMRLEAKDTPTGDLACDIKSDPASANVENTLDAWKTHLSLKRACTGATEALETAWKSYRSYVRTHSD
ncbi:YozE family protein [Anaerotruncus massiliensis (ex Liu et al. 2021)]|uniref:YozE family protein n=1 Tax=Anaerotruncus massiliensis (ex Liu et al. 2021) TaxID=2321404 RepID=UPI003AB3E8B5